MKLIDLEHALHEVLKTGQLGTPVALRILVATPQTEIDPFRFVGRFAPLIRAVSEVTRGKIQARRHPSGRQLSIVWNDAQGRTVSLTIVSTPDIGQSLRVLVVGNHGITQLNGGEAWNEDLTSDTIPLWEKEIAESLKQGTSIAVGDS